MPERPTYEQANNFLYYTDLHYISPEKKTDPLWAAACLTFAKWHNRPLVNPEEVSKAVSRDSGEIDAAKYKEAFDPKTPDGAGGKADYLSADWKANPIHVHINNIVDTNMEKIPVNLYCKAIDEYAMLKQQKENMRILGRREFMNFLNEINVKLGYPKLKSTDDPFKYVQEMGKTQQPKTSDSGKISGDAPASILDAIKAAIDDNESLALFNEYIYKGDVEIAIELGLKHYFQINKFQRISERLIQDIRRYNRACGRWYTSMSTGRPIMEYLSPDKVYTSKYSQSDGNDISSWFIEYDITFGEFVRMVGRKLDSNQLKNVFEKNKMHQAAHGLDWDRCSFSQRQSALIRIGYHEWESQDCYVFAKGSRYGNPRFKEKPYDWRPSKNAPKEFKDVRDERHYNVWYKCYYIPIVVTHGTSLVNVTDFISQSEYIFDFGKVQDMQRYGENDRNCKSSLVLWKKDGMSFSDIMDRYMPKIHLLWQKYQNYIIQNDVYVIYANELLESMMKLADDGDKKSETGNKMEFLKMLVQTGKGMSSMHDGKGNKIDPVAVFRPGYAEAAASTLLQMRGVYNEMTLALSMSDVREGIDPKPRTSLGGIQLSLEASNNGTYFIEKGYIDIYLEFANRMLYYMMQIVTEGDSQRLNEFKAVVGLANGLALEAINDIPKHNLGLYIDNVNTDKQKQYLVEMADQMVKAGQLDMDAFHLIIKIENYKYAAVMLVLKWKEKLKRNAQEEEIKHRRILELKQADLAIKRQEYISKEEAKTISITAEKQWDYRIEKMIAELRAQTQAMIKDVTSQNRMVQDTHKAELDKEKTAA